MRIPIFCDAAPSPDGCGPGARIRRWGTRAKKRGLSTTDSHETLVYMYKFVEAFKDPQFIGVILLEKHDDSRIPIHTTKNSLIGTLLR